MNKFKLFVENFLVYGFGGIISKLVPLVMVPIITRLMPNTAYFGISDLSNTVIQFASAIACMGMYDAMYRMFFERDEEKYKKEVCSSALIFTALSSLIIFIFMIIFRSAISRFFFGDRKYANLIYITAIATLVGATNSIISAPTRMQNKRKVYLVTNTLSPLIAYGIAIPLLINGYYLIALPLSAMIASMTMEVIFYFLNKDWFKIKYFNKNALINMLKIGIPLLPNFLIYWVFNSSDKVMITNLLNVGQSGVYSVGAKLGMASQLIYTAFSGGWQYFAFSTMKEEDQVGSNSRIFEYLGIISFISSTFICAWSYGIYKLLFTGKYVQGFIISPYLFLAPLLQMLFQVACNQFLIIKNTWPNMFILSSGAILNIALNFILIPVIGIEGASIATLIGYIASDIICCIVLIKMKLMVISKRFLFCCLSMIIFFIIWRVYFTKNIILGTLIAIVESIIMIIFYKKDIMRIVKSIKK